METGHMEVRGCVVGVNYLWSIWVVPITRGERGIPSMREKGIMLASTSSQGCDHLGDLGLEEWWL